MLHTTSLPPHAPCASPVWCANISAHNHQTSKDLRKLATKMARAQVSTETGPPYVGARTPAAASIQLWVIYVHPAKMRYVP